MNPFLDKIRETLSRLTPRQKFQLAAGTLATLALVWSFTIYVNRIRYGVLFSNLDRNDASPVIAALKDRQIPYKLSAGGSIIEVPFQSIDELRLEMAAEGLPPGGGVGFELFDKPSFGLSDFVQNVNFRRALERELSRTIQSLDVIDSARVHLALPPESVFADDHREPSASVVVRLHSGRSLGGDRVRAISHLVASGVEGLDPARVSVIDTEGRMISSGDDSDPQTLSATQVDARKALENNIEATLVSILEPLVGSRKVRARATVELKTTRVERIEESYDPNSAVVRSEDKSKSRNQGPASAGGIPGTDANLPGGVSSAAAGTGGEQDSSRTLTNFEISKTVSTISEPVGGLARQSIAVVIDHALIETTGENGEVTRTPTPRSAEEMQKITELVRAAVGLDDARGDQLIVENIPFDESGQQGEEAEGVDVVGLLLKISRYGSLPLAVLLLALLVIRPAIAALRSVGQSTAGDNNERLPPTIAQLQAQLSGGELASLATGESPLRQKLIEGVTEDPQAAAMVIRGWLEGRKEKR